MYFDTHVHFDGIKATDGVDAVLERARVARVGRMLAVGGDIDRNAFCVELAGRYSAVLRAAIGYDRDCVGCQCPVDRLEALIRKSGHVVAVGEIGLDYHYLPDSKPQQRDLFAGMLDIARRCRRPVVVHSRLADDDTIELLRSHCVAADALPGGPGVLHCFTGDAGFAKRLLELDMYVSFSGIATFRNADSIRAAAAVVAEDRILLETDSPYLAPVPHRGKPNEPALVGAVAAILAEVRGIRVEELAEMTTRNANRLFNWAAQNPIR